ELPTDAPGDRAEVTRVDADATQLGTGDTDGRLDALRDVVGVHQQGRVDAEGLDLGAEGQLLVRGAVVVDVQQRPRMRGGAGGRDAVTVGGLQVGGGGETRQVGGPGGGDRRVLVGAAGTHLDDRATVGGRDHTRGGRGDRGVR